MRSRLRSNAAKWVNERRARREERRTRWFSPAVVGEGEETMVPPRELAECVAADAIRRMLTVEAEARNQTNYAAVAWRRE